MTLTTEKNSATSVTEFFNYPAEFGITIRKSAMGKGYSIQAMRDVLNIGFGDMGLEQIYWCVSPKNKRAVRFYDKNGFHRVQAADIEAIEGYTEEQIAFYIWYAETTYVPKQNGVTKISGD